MDAPKMPARMLASGSPTPKARFYVDPDRLTEDRAILTGACFNGGCERPFHEDGCGGMRESMIR